MAKVRECPRCKKYMSEDSEGAWCDECGYEIVYFNHKTTGGEQ
jgi:ribosomal protein S27AE